MKNWQEMKDLTFVNIKITKAKSISEGLTRCKIQKLSRNNPVYQHLRIHKKHKKVDNCHICTSPQHQNDKNLKQVSKEKEKGMKIKIKMNRRSKTEQIRHQFEVNDSCFTRMKTESSRYGDLSLRLDKIMQETPRRPQTPIEQVIDKGERIKNAIKKFDESVNRSRTYFSHLNKGIQKAQGYFLTSIDDIELEINEDKGLSLRQIKSDYQKFKDDMNLDIEKMKKLKKRKKQLEKPIIFPFNTNQMQNIVNSDTKNKDNETKKIKKVITNLYEYKSNLNYSKRMKMVNQLLKKQN